MDKEMQKRKIDEQREANLNAVAAHLVVSQEEWNEARLALMKREKQLMKLNDELAAEKRALPWVKIEKQYYFNSRKGKVSLSDLFEGRSQLFVKHFMMGPHQDWQCSGCSLEVDHVAQLLEHFAHHDMSYVAIARAPLDEIEVVRKKMNWHFNWVSSDQSDFNYDFHVSFRPEQVAAGNAIYNFTEFNLEGSADLREIACSTRTGRGKSSTHTVRLVAAESNSSGSTHSSTCSQKVAKNTGRCMRFPTGRSHTTRTATRWRNRPARHLRLARKPPPRNGLRPAGITLFLSRPRSAACLPRS
jgi:predicted dithiol-disulfide oxidoreductase (DUF899 family)